MKIAALFLLSVAALGGTCFGAEPDASVLALGAWSQPVRTPNYMKLRGRLKICEYPNNRGLAPSIDVALYVELQEFSDSVGGPEEVYFDPQALKCELTDGAGQGQRITDCTDYHVVHYSGQAERRRMDFGAAHVAA